MRQLSLTTLFLLISAMIFAGPNGRFVYHTVEKGETLYSISHMYGLKPADVAQYNDAIGDKLTIHIGQKIKIPASDVDASADITPASSVASPAKTAAVPAKETSVNKYHTVEKGETIYSISKMYDISRDDLLSWNKIKDNKIAIGQKLVIKDQESASVSAESTPATGSAPVPSKAEAEKAMKKDGYTWTLPSQPAKNPGTNVSTATADATASASGGGLADTRTIKSWKAESASDMKEYYKGKPNVYDPATEYESLYYQNIYSGMLKKSETGVAKFLTDNNTANTAYYNNAPIGTILKLTNADNGKTTYAIVVGKIPQAEQNSYLMKLSGKVARNLAAKDYSSIEIVCYTEN